MHRTGRNQRRITPHDLMWPDTPEFTSVAAKFATNATDQMLSIVWQGYLSFKIEHLSSIDITLAEEEIERSITQALEPQIRACMSGDESYYVQHGPYEIATRAPAPAQPPEYDIAFILKNNKRIMWPMEAKILRTPATVAAYIKDINTEFLTGRYAPFSTSAAMIGYLLSGKASKVPSNIGKQLGTKLKPHPKFYPKYPHHITTHSRTLEDPNWYSGPFECHHLIFQMTP